MKYILSVVLSLCLSCAYNQSSQFTYNLALDELKVLDIDSSYSDKQIEQALYQFLTPYEQSLKLNYQRSKLTVTGKINAIKTFEYLYLTLIKYSPEISICGTILNPITNEQLTLRHKLSAFEKVYIEEENFSYELQPWIDKFDDSLRLDFHFASSNTEAPNFKSFSVSFNEFFKNNQSSKNYIKSDLNIPHIRAHFESVLKVNWKINNCHLLESLSYQHLLNNSKEITAMPIFNLKQFLEITGDTRDYLSIMGLNLSKDDFVTISEQTKNIVLLSNQDNCQRFREIFRPLCGFPLKTTRINGRLFEGNQNAASFNLPVSTDYQTNASFMIDNDNNIWQEFSLKCQQKFFIKTNPTEITFSIKIADENWQEEDNFSLNKEFKYFYNKKQIENRKLDNTYKLELSLFDGSSMH